MSFSEKIVNRRDRRPPAKEAADFGHDDPSRNGRSKPTERGQWAIKWSFLILMATGLIQAGIVALSGSVALLADTVHNFGDAFTTLPLWIAFGLARKSPSRRFTYGYGRVEDLAGLIIVVVILASAALAGYESALRFMNPREVSHLAVVALAAVVGFVGNEVVAQFRIRVGKRIKSAALEADGKHARVDGLTSLGVLAGVLGIRMGWAWADPLVGILITLVIVHIAWDSGKTVIPRLLDAVDPEVVDRVKEILQRQADVEDVSDIRMRWLGHRMLAEANLAVAPELTVANAHTVAAKARRAVRGEIGHIRNIIIHVDPKGASEEAHH
jgi:cation diffusion facilitator family transporter